MYRFVLCGLVPVLFAVLVLGQEPTVPIRPEEAAKKVGQETTLRMEVKSATLLKTVCFLNSEDDFKDAKNFTIFIGKDALAKFKEAKIEDPADHFKGKTIDVKGKVTLFRERPQIEMNDPAQIKLVPKKNEDKK